MLPILRALRERLLNEPVFFLGALSVAALVVKDHVEVPTWAQAVAVGVFTLAARSVVDGPKTVGRKRRGRGRAVKKEAGYSLVEALLVVFIVLVILLVVFRLA